MTYRKGQWVKVIEGDQLAIVVAPHDEGYLVHQVDPHTGETRMAYDKVRERELTAAVIVPATGLRAATPEDIPAPRRPPPSPAASA